MSYTGIGQNEMPYETEQSCDDVLQLVEIIFSKEPKSPYSYRFDVTNPHDMFRTLGQFLTHGITFLYGDNVKVDTMSYSQVEKIQSYLKSFGWVAVINPQSVQNHPDALPYFLKIPRHKSTSNQDSDCDFVNIIFEPFK